jgi:hypothetical protein
MNQISPADWQAIRDVLRGALRSSLQVGIASLNPDGSPHVTPIGSLFLGDLGQGFYFEAYAKTLAQNIEHDPRICVSLTNSDRWRFLVAIARGRAGYPFGVRLHGTAGRLRDAMPSEVGQFMRRVRRLRFLRGHGLIWARMRQVRDVQFHSFDLVKIPPLGKVPWPEKAEP